MYIFTGSLLLCRWIMVLVLILTAACRTVQTSTWGSESASWQPGSGQLFFVQKMSPKSLWIPRTDLVQRASSREESYCFSLNETSFHNFFLSKLVFFVPFLTFHVFK